MNEKLRNPKIDNLRALAVVTVFLSHVIQYVDPNYLESYTLRFVSSFQMPLFMFISGYLARSFTLEKLRLRSFRLLVPLVTWSLILACFSNEGNYISKFGDMFIYPAFGLWFLPTLFFSYLILFLWKKFSSNTLLPLITIPILYIIHFKWPHLSKYFGLSLIRWYFFFYYLGVLFQKDDALLAFLRRKVVWLLVSVIATISIFHYQKIMVVNVFGISLNSVLYIKVWTLLVKYMAGMSVIALLWSVKQRLEFKNQFMIWISKNALVICAASLVCLDALESYLISLKQPLLLVESCPFGNHA